MDVMPANGICSYINVESNTGYISGINFTDVNHVVWRVYFKIVEGLQCPKDQIAHFFSDNTNPEEHEIFIFLILQKQPSPIMLSERKENKIFLVINGVNQEKHTLLNLHKLPECEIDSLLEYLG